MATGYLVLRDRVGYLNWDGWFLYAAFCDTGTDQGLVKIGISRTPLKRAVALMHGSPFRINALLWTMAGKRPVAQRLEARLKRAFQDRNTRGEWFQFNFADKGDKEVFHAATRLAYRMEVGGELKWDKASQDVIDREARKSLDQLKRLGQK